MNSQFRVVESGTPNSKKRRLDSATDSNIAAAATNNLIDIDDTQTALFNADSEDTSDEFDPLSILTDKAIDVPASTLVALIQSLNSVNEIVNTLNTTVKTLDEKVTRQTKEIKGLKKVIKVLYKRTNTNSSVPATPEPTEPTAAPQPQVQVPNSSTARNTTSQRRQRAPTAPNDGNKEAVWALKKKVVPLSGRKYFSRTNDYNRSFTNTYRAGVLREQATGDKPYIPPKFRKNYARDETHYKILEKRSIGEMKSSVEELLFNAEVANNSRAKTDAEVIGMINRHSVPAEKAELLKLWEEECLAGEAHSRQGGERSWSWLKDLPAEKPYFGFESCKPDARPQFRPQTRPNYRRDTRRNVARYNAEFPVANDAHWDPRRHQGNQRSRRNDEPAGGGGGGWKRQGRQDFRQGPR